MVQLPLQAWLNYQEEIGLLHTPEKKNQTNRRQTPAEPTYFMFVSRDLKCCSCASKILFP